MLIELSRANQKKKEKKKIRKNEKEKSWRSDAPNIWPRFKFFSSVFLEIAEW